MKKSRFTDEQIIGFLKQVKAGPAVKECNDPPLSAQVRPLKHTP